MSPHKTLCTTRTGNRHGLMLAHEMLCVAHQMRYGGGAVEGASHIAASLGNFTVQ
jgi:hypothetical protein